MRWLLCMVGLALALAPCAAADVPAGFVSHPELASRVQFIPAKPINVYCATDDDAWARATASRHLADAGGFVDWSDGLPGDSAYLSLGVCVPLLDKVAGRPIYIDSFAQYVLALTHEAEHLAGHRDEHETDCAALAVIRDVARNFGFRRAKLRERIYDEAWYWHNRKPLPYSGPCPS